MDGETGAAGAATAGRLPGRVARRRFLDVLGMTANVSRAAREAGVGTCSFYRLRRADEAFHAAWEAALDEGCRQIEMMLLAAALGEPLAEGVDRKQVLEILARREARGRTAPLTMRGRQVAIETVERSLLRKLDALDRRWQREGTGGDGDRRGAVADVRASDGETTAAGMAGCGGETDPGGTAGAGPELAGLGA